MLRDIKFMKAIVKTITTVEGNKITITGELIDVAPSSLIAQRNTIMHPVNGKFSHPRHFQNNSHGMMILRNGTDGVLFPKDEMVAVALEIDSKLTDAPVFSIRPSIDSLTGKVASEIPVTAKIQHSDDGKDWTDVEKADANFKGESGKFYRCIATNKNGSTVSGITLIPKPK